MLREGPRGSWDFYLILLPRSWHVFDVEMPPVAVQTQGPLACADLLCCVPSPSSVCCVGFCGLIYRLVAVSASQEPLTETVL